jgi:tetratricopeptide (TPR) repeat protein
MSAHERAEARRAAMAAAKIPTTKRPQRRRKLPVDVASELGSAVPARQLARVELRLADASRAYSRDRYPEALSILRELVRTTPKVAAVRELYGLTFYRMGRWKEAIRELNAFYEISGSVDQHPVLADCERALRNHEHVTQLWNELRQYGAGSDVLAEGRLVMAGSFADRGKIAEAIDLLSPSVTRNVRKPLDRHLRQWYALADLYERSGDVPRARELFRKVVDADSELSDALERLAALR